MWTSCEFSVRTMSQEKYYSSCLEQKRRPVLYYFTDRISMRNSSFFLTVACEWNGRRELVY